MTFIENLFEQFANYLPVMMRVSSFIMAIPIFGSGVPPLTKIGLAAFITFFIGPIAGVEGLPQDLAGYMLIIVEEVAVGLALGLVVAMIFMAIYLAGQFIDVPMGFGMVNIVDPQVGVEVPVIAQFKFALALLIFFIIDGHHMLLWALVDSYRALPPGVAVMNEWVLQTAVDAFSAMFLLGLRIALPIMAALFLTDVGLGIVARAVPQINVFFVGFPLKIGLGFALLAVVLPVYVAVVEQAYGMSGQLLSSLERMLQALNPPQS